jgi:hypothetical protein
MSTAEICALVVKVLLNAAIEAGAGVIPGDLLRDLEGRLDELKSVASVEGAVRKANETLQQKADEALKGAGQKAGQKLEGILRGK